MLLKKAMGEGEQEPAGDPTSPDNTPAHENAESPQLEQSEGSEEDGAEEGGGENDASNVSPEEQKMYDQFTTACLAFLYKDEKSLGIILNKLQTEAQAQGQQQGKEVSGLGFAIGHTAAMILQSVAGAIKKQGHEVPGDIIFNAGKELVAELVDVAINAKMATEDQRMELVKQGMIAGAKVYGNSMMAQGQVSKQDQQDAAAQLQQGQAQPEMPPQGMIQQAQQGA